jgi:hypothetical protein
MENININNLFRTNKFSSNDKPLDVNSLCIQNNNENNENNNKTEFSIDNLLSHKEERKRKVKDKYRYIYNVVLKKIKNVNKINDTTDIIYDVPEIIFGIKDYRSDDCIEYIQTKLRNLYYMDTLKLSNKSIFISWKNIEDNRKITNTK